MVVRTSGTLELLHGVFCVFSPFLSTLLFYCGVCLEDYILYKILNIILCVTSVVCDFVLNLGCNTYLDVLSLFCAQLSMHIMS